MSRELESPFRVMQAQSSDPFSRMPAPMARREAPGADELSLTLLARQLRRWWLARVERHCLICADVEERCARQAQQNVAYYQKQAALARSARL